MAANPFTQSDAGSSPVPPLNRAIVAQADSVVMSGASWFWWIAGLSVVNTVMIHSGTDRTFVIGLGFTMLADIIFKDLMVVALVIDVVVLSVFAGFGLMARKGHLWAFVTGIVLYTLDSLIYVLGQDWMSVGFHAFALFYMVRGALALRTALKAAANPPPEAAAPPVASA